MMSDKIIDGFTPQQRRIAGQNDDGGRVVVFIG
jgi:hypothetical protein